MNAKMQFKFEFLEEKKIGNNKEINGYFGLR